MKMRFRTTQAAPDPDLAPSAGEILALLALTGLYLVSDTFVGERGYPLINRLGPVVLVGILAWGSWRLVHRDGRRLWTALFWFRLSTAVYFGIGTLLVFVISPSERRYLEGFYWFWEEDIFKLNLIVAVSVSICLLFARLVIHRANGDGRTLLDTRLFPATHDPERDLLSVATVFLIVGFAVKFFLKLPYAFGWNDFEVPGSIMNISRLAPAGIFLITLWSLRRGKKALPLITVFVFLELCFQLVLFSKAELLYVLLMFMLAFMWDKVTVKRLVVCAAVIIPLFTVLQPLVAAGRRELEVRHGDEPQAGFSERFEIVRAYFSGGEWLEEGSDSSTALTRLSYVNVATLVISRFDAGQPADWPKLVWAVFVPRFLWPEKPVITDIARDIYELGTGRRTSQVGAGLFADSYWAMGWWGVVLYMSIYGVLLGLLTIMSSRILQQGRWIFFPIVLMGLQIGFRTDGHYIADVAGGSVIVIGSFAVLYVVDVVLRGIAGGVVSRSVAVSRRPA